MSDIARKGRAISRKGIKSRYRNFDIKADEYNNRAQRELAEMRSAFYAGIDPRRYQEMADGGMVQEDPNAMANLSNQFIHTEYPQVGYRTNKYLNTLMEDE